MRFSARLLATAFLLTAVMLGPARAGLFNPDTYTLDNGMEVVVIPDHRAPVVVHMVWYRVGSADEQAGKSGIAHFLEHLMFRGTKNLEDGEFSQIVARNGGQDNAFTSYDYTGYFQQVAADKLDLVMGLEADRMVNLQLTEDVVETERRVILEERAQRVDTNPAALLNEQMSASQYLAHSYRIPVIGWRHEIEQLGHKDVVDFYRRYYAPNNAILIVAGDVTGEEVLALAEKHYGPIPRADTPPRKRLQEPPQISPRRVELSDVRVAEPSWQRTYLAPSRNAGETRHAIPLRVLADILGSGPTSRLYRALVVEQGIAAAAGAYYRGTGYDLTEFYFSAVPRNGGDLATLEAAVEAVIDDLLKNGITEGELERAKNSMLASAIYARDSLSAGARVFGSGMTSGLTVEEIESWPDLVQAVTLEQVNEAARAVLKIERSVTGLLKPKPAS